MQNLKLAVVVAIILAFLGLIISPVLAQVPLQDAKLILFGDLSVGTILGYFVLIIIGATLHVYLEAKDRDKDSPHTPYKWSWKFFILDNIKRGLVTILLAFVCVRFFEDLTGSSLTPVNALIWGFGIDSFTVFGKKGKGLLKAKRDKLFPQ